MATKQDPEFTKKYQEFIEDRINKRLESRNSESNSKIEIFKIASGELQFEELNPTDQNFDQKFKEILIINLFDLFIDQAKRKENTNYKINKVEFYYRLGDNDKHVYSFRTI